MPVTITAGFSRKVGEPNYGSRGASLHLEVELDRSALDDPDRFLSEVEGIFERAREAVDRELERGRPSPSESCGPSGELSDRGIGGTYPRAGLPSGSSRTPSPRQVQRAHVKSPSPRPRTHIALLCFADGHALPLNQNMDIGVYKRAISPTGSLFGQITDGDVKQRSRTLTDRSPDPVLLQGPGRFFVELTGIVREKTVNRATGQSRKMR